jgi:hypothetical protein
MTAAGVMEEESHHVGGEVAAEEEECVIQWNYPKHFCSLKILYSN